LGGEEHIFSFRGTTENLGRWTWKICSWSWICEVTLPKIDDRALDQIRENQHSKTEKKQNSMDFK
jgi:hypothetical protein